MPRLGGVSRLLLLRVVRPEGVDGLEAVLTFRPGDGTALEPVAFLLFDCWDLLGGMVVGTGNGKQVKGSVRIINGGV